MRVFLHSDNAERSARYLVTISPAADTGFVSSADVLKDWTLADGTPKQIEVIFSYGAAEVTDEIGKYMVKRGLAHRTRLLRVLRRKLFNRDGSQIEEVFDETGAPITFDEPAAAH